MPVEAEQFRKIFGALSSSVAVITTAGADGPKGFTCTAVTAVSKNPPLLLVCADSGSRTLPAILASQGFAVNFLAAGRGALADRFASSDAHKFTGTAWTPSPHACDAPVLTGDTVAVAECRLRSADLVGDHWIVVGSIEHGRHTPDAAPLTYYRRAYDAPSAPRLVTTP
ncbi:flavin reductase family protein [Streptomyces sp. NPDC029526]|uniref:flavin reductase family protein n=1 Tax=Streptomyces sp. NPDC029526 TaxID=3155728 RepID=UPI0033F6E8D7